MSIVVVIPSRGRPERAWEAVHAIRQTAHLVSTSVILTVDADDPELRRYRELRWDGFGPEALFAILEPEDTGNLTRATNAVSMRVVADDPDAIVGNLGDDHIVRTPGWDVRITEALATPGIAYGDDQIHGPRMPTAPFISGLIIRALGWYAMPSCEHMYIDDAWKSLGLATGTLRYLDDVTIEHLHPAVGKADWDEGYRRVNSPEAMGRDHAAYFKWRNTTFYDDVNNIRRAIREAHHPR